MGTSSLGKRVRLVEECPHFEDGLRLDKNYEKLMSLVQHGDENLDSCSVDHVVVEHVKLEALDSDYGWINERSDKRPRLDASNTPQHLTSSVVMEEVKLEAPDSDSGWINERSEKRPCLEASNTPQHLKSSVVMEEVKSEALDSDSGGSREHCNRRPRLEVSNTPKMLQREIKRRTLTRRVMKKEKMKINRPNKSAHLLPSKKTGMGKKVNVEAAHAVSGRSNVRSSKGIGSQVPHFPQRRRNYKASSILIDETYLEFLNSAEMDGDQMIYTPGNGRRNIYEEDLQSSSDSELNVPDNDRHDPDLNHFPFVKTKTASNRTLRTGTMKKKMNCSKNSEETSSDSELHVLNNHRRDGYHASFVKKKNAIRRTLKKTVSPRNKHALSKKYSMTPTEDLEDLPVKKTGAAKKNVKFGALNPVSGKSNGCPPKRPHSEALRFSQRGRHCDAECDVEDESYGAFINLVELDGKHMIYTPSNGGRKIYEDAETSSDAETIAMPRDSLDRYRTVDLDRGLRIESDSPFREELMKDLERPYNQEEYTKLLEDASNQGPSDHDTDPLNGMKSCQPLGEYGKSYLEVYKDLNEKINAADGDRARILNLLRGFFYWLKNVSQKGSFIPWKDKKCLRMLPQP